MSLKTIFNNIQCGLDSFTFYPDSDDAFEPKTAQDISDEAWRMSDQAWIMTGEAWIMTGEALRDTFVKHGVIA